MPVESAGKMTVDLIEWNQALSATDRMEFDAHWMTVMLLAVTFLRELLASIPIRGLRVS
jgi:hypothetical protein